MKARGKSPTQRTKDELAKRGVMLMEVTERWNAFAKIRQDLFGFIDILCVINGRVLGIQATTKANMWARIQKSLESPKLPIWLTAGDFEVWGWDVIKRPGSRTVAAAFIKRITREDGIKLPEDSTDKQMALDIT